MTHICVTYVMRSSVSYFQKTMFVFNMYYLMEEKFPASHRKMILNIELIHLTWMFGLFHYT